MLIITRRVGERVMIGTDVTFTILGVRGAQVRVGIDAPKAVAVDREEIWNRKERGRAGCCCPGDGWAHTCPIEKHRIFAHAHKAVAHEHR